MRLSTDIDIIFEPDINCILGDKLTAFAPHTTGIPLNAKKDMEVYTQKFYTEDMKKLKYLRKVNLEAYGYAIKAEHLMKSQ